VGGGALASACIQGLAEAPELGVLAPLPRLHCVQTEGAYPHVRAWDRLVDRLLAGAGDGEDRATRSRRAASAPRERIASALADAAARRSAYMWPWESEPRSIASGILDDETYDWLALVEGMLATGGHPIVVGEARLSAAHRLGRSATGIRVDPTGTAGLAGALELAATAGLAPGETVAFLFTGRDRGTTLADGDAMRLQGDGSGAGGGSIVTV
jgi:threonine synthase